MIFGENLDFEIVVQSICADLYNAEILNYLPQIKKRHNIAFLPKIHRLYSGPLKMAGYKRLSNKKTLFVISQGADNEGITMYNESISFMGKNRDFKSGFIKKITTKINTSNEGFEFIENELPYIRIIGDFDEIYFFKIGKDETLEKIYTILTTINKLGNIVFLSDLHSGLSQSKCEKADEESITNAEKCDIFILDIFLGLALIQSHKLRVIGYSNTAYLNGNKKDTTGYCTIMA